MCGFFGSFGAGAADLSAFHETLSALLRHRGPDDSGYARGENWELAFRRLSILDLTPSGHQPMCTADERYWLVLNGEIYNYVELRRQLESKGETFAGTSDTEVLLRLLVRDGVSALYGLNGMFAFAFVDTQQRTFLIARDRLGVKPLYYTYQKGQLRFASELKALLAWPDAERTVSSEALVQYLALNYLPAESCIFEGYRKLPAGSYLQGSIDCPYKAEPQEYWSLRINSDGEENNISAAELDELEELLVDSVRIRLRSDVPIGVFLSGGIDSGLVAKLSGMASNGAPPLALTVSFSDKDYDESSLAQMTAQMARLEHRLVHQRPSSLQDVDRIMWYFDEPFGDASALPTFALCEAAAQHATVFLSGDGGDEAFGGYRRYIEAQHYQWLRNIPAVVRSAFRSSAAFLPSYASSRYRLTKSMLPDDGFAAAFDGIPSDPVLRRILHPSLKGYSRCAGKNFWRRWSTTQGSDTLTRQRQLDYDLYLPDDILVKVDRASMAHSIEVRSPFLDYRIVEWAARLSRNKLINSREGKLPLRRLADRLLPKEVCAAAKRGFGVPLDSWFRDPEGAAFVKERLISPEAAQRGWWDIREVEKIIGLHVAGSSRQFDGWLWRLLVLDAWARHYVGGTKFLEGAPLAKA